MLLGRSAPESPPIQYSESDKFCQRVAYVGNVEKTWWKSWIKEVLPTLLPARKWKSRSRNLSMGDIVMLTYSGNLKDDYILAKVTETYPDEKGLVRNVTVKFRRRDMNENRTKYKSSMIEEKVAVQRLVLLEPSQDTDNPLDSESGRVY